MYPNVCIGKGDTSTNHQFFGIPRSGVHSWVVDVIDHSFCKECHDIFLYCEVKDWVYADDHDRDL